LTAESLPLARYQRMNRKTFGTFFNMLENVARENNLSDTPGNIFNIDESGLQLNKKPASVITENASKIVRVLTSGEESETILVTACAYVAIQFLPTCCNMQGRQQ
jgi:hypothetical protein